MRDKREGTKKNVLRFLVEHRTDSEVGDVIKAGKMNNFLLDRLPSASIVLRWSYKLTSENKYLEEEECI